MKKESRRGLSGSKRKVSIRTSFAHDDETSPLELHTDACATSIGGVLMVHREEVRKPIAYVSKRLNPHEERYDINELEFFAVIWSLQQFRHHVYE